MSQMTKHAIADSLKSLIEERPLSKITISDITDHCGISRMTFYYHFQDVYDLIDWICKEETGKIIENNRAYSTWEECMLAVCKKVQDDNLFIRGVYQSVQREHIENYLYNVFFDILKGIIDAKSEGLFISEEDKVFIADFYKYAFVGIALDWVRKGMKKTPEDLVESISKVIEGGFVQTIKNFAE